MSHVLPAVDSIHNVSSTVISLVVLTLIEHVFLYVGWHILSLFGVTWWFTKGKLYNII